MKYLSRRKLIGASLAGLGTATIASTSLLKQLVSEAAPPGLVDKTPPPGHIRKTPTATPTETATAEPEPTPTESDEPTPTLEPEPEPTATSEPEIEPTATTEPEPTATATPEPDSEFTYVVDSLDELTALDLQPGESVALRRGTVYQGHIRMPDSWVGTEEQPIVIGATGEGPPPRIECSTSENVVTFSEQNRWIVVRDLDLVHTEEAYGGNRDSSGNLTGFINGVVINGADCTVRGCRISGNANGVLTRDPSRRARILYCLFTENYAVQGPTVGNSAIQVRGGGHEIRSNVAHDNAPPGSPHRHTFIELFKAWDVTVTYNEQRGGRKFVEMGSGGGVISRDNLFAYNVHWTDIGNSRFLVGRGEGVDFGPVYNTQIINNTVWLTGGNSEAIVYGGGGENLCTIYNNSIVAVNKGLFKGVGGEVFEDYNIWHRYGGGNLQLQNHTIGANSLRVDPLLVDPPHDLRPQDDSPAIGAGQDGVDIGAYQMSK